MTAIGLAAAGVLWNAERSFEHLRLAAAAFCFCIAALLLAVGDPERATVLALVIVAAVHGASALKYAHSGLKLTMTDLPLCVGFGVSRPEHVRELKELADGVIVGSALVKKLEAAGADRGKALAEVKGLVAELSGALR